MPILLETVRQRIKSLCDNNVSLANSMRTLKAYAQAVGTQIGVGLGSALRHVIILLNTMMKYVLKAATAFATFMQTIFGKYKGGASGIAMEGLGDAVDYADDLGNAADNAAGGLGDAADNAKQLAKDLSVLPFDELNQLNKDREETASGTGSGGTGGGKGAGGGVVDGLLDWGDLLENSEAGKLPDAISEWGKRIRKAFDEQNWVGLGNEIAKGLNDGLEKVYKVLDPNNVRKKVFPFIDAFTTTFNSFINSFDFNLLGRTIGRGINDLVLILNRTIEGINWHDLGKQLASGVAGMLEEINFTDLGNLLGNKFMILWNTLNGFVHNFPWGQLGIDIADFFNGVFEKVNFTTIADTLATGLNGVFTSLGTFTENFKWDDLVDNIAGGISTFISEFDWKGNGEKLGNFLSNLCDALIDVIDTVDWEAFGQGLADFLQQLPWGKILKTVGKAIVDALGGILRGMASKPAGGFVVALINGMIAFKIGSKLIPFVNNIGKAVSGEESFSIVKLALQKLFKKGVKEAAESTVVETAAESAGKSLVGSFKGGLAGLGTVAAEFGIVTLAVGGTVAAIYGLTRWVDKLQGGNGKITESGEALEAYIERIGESGQLSSQQVDTLWKEIEDMETAGYSTADMIDHVRGRLDEWKVSTDSQYGALQTLNSEGTTSKNIIDEMAQSYATTGDASAKYSEDVDLAFETVKQALYDARDATGDYSGRYDEVVRQLTESQGTFHTTQDVINATSAIMESVGLSADSLGSDFDELATKAEQDAQRVSDASESMKSGISLGFEGAGGAVDKYVGNAAQKVQQNIRDMASAANATTDYSNTTSQSMSSATASTGSWFSNVVGKLEGYRRGLKDASGSVSSFDRETDGTLSNNNASWNSWNLSTVASMVKMGVQTAKSIQLTQTMSDSMAGHTRMISTAFSTMAREISTSMANVASGIQSGMSGVTLAVQSAISDVYRNLQSMGLEMFRAGQNMGQSLANGFSSIHIPMPHMYVAWWQQVNFGNGGYMFYPEFGLQWYRKGGLFQGGNGQMIGIAEDGRDEAVLPLEDRRAMARIGSAIADAGGNGSGMSEDMMDKLASRIAEVILATQDNREQPMNYVELKVEEEVLARAVTRGQQRLDYRNNPTPQMA